MNVLVKQMAITTLLCVFIATSGGDATAATKLQNGPNNGKYAMLTYDDCPYSPWVGSQKRVTTPNGPTPEAALANYKATIDEVVRQKAVIVVAPTGMCVTNFKKKFNVDIAEYARQRGQLVVSHSYDHPHLANISKKAIRYQMNNSVGSYWVRPPYGSVDAQVHQVLKSMNRKAWTWTYSSSDFKGYSQEHVVSSNVQNCRTGDTCLLHMHFNGFTPEAMRQTIEGMRASSTKVCGLKTDASGKPVRTTVRWRALTCVG